MVAMEVSTSALNVYKRRGETPLECLRRLQRAYPELTKEPLTYAGRLDPLAEGVLVVLVGDEGRRKDLYLNLKKRYRFDVLFGFATDTYDLAGMVTASQKQRISIMALMELVSKLPGTWEEAYPPFSSKPVLGRPLHEWAREGRLHEISIPHHEVSVFESVVRHSETITGIDIGNAVHTALSLLQGDFRQPEILKRWDEALKDRSADLFDVTTIEIACSRGTYVRSIAQALGQALGIPALAYRIVRTSVGSYSLDDALRIED